MREFLRDDAAIAILINPENPLSESERGDAEAASRALGVDTFCYTQMQQMATLAMQSTVPVIGPLREFAVEDGLLSYGTNVPDVNRQAGVLVAKVPRGRDQ